MKPQEFIQMIAPAAQEYQQKHGIYASVTIAQAALETGWGKFLPIDKYTGKKSFNLFGVKGAGPAGSVTCETQEFVGGKLTTVEAKFRAYNNWDESIADHNLVLLQSRYKPVRDAVNWKAACMYLQSCGYATDPHYGAKLIQIIDTHKLFDYDQLPVPFPDVPLGHWAAPALARMKDAGVIAGDKDTNSFRGDQPPTRYEMVAALDALHKLMKS